MNDGRRPAFDAMSPGLTKSRFGCQTIHLRHRSPGVHHFIIPTSNGLAATNTRAALQPVSLTRPKVFPFHISKLVYPGRLLRKRGR